MLSGYFPSKAKEYLEYEFEIRLKRRPNYSLRAFARDMDLSPSTLSEFLSDKVGFSKGRVTSISNRLNLSIEHREHFWDLMEAQYGREPQTRKVAKIRAKSRIKNSSSQMPLEAFRVVSDWRHFAILELLSMNAKYQDVTLLSKALRMTKSDVQSALNRLLIVGAIEKKNDRYTVPSENTITDCENPDEAARLFHGQLLAKAVEALDQHPMAERDFRSYVISFQKQDYPLIIEELNRSFLKILGRYVEKENRDQLYCFSYQLHNLKSNQEG